MIQYEIETRTEIGTRDEQQDYANFTTNNGMIFAVLCDGMGGHNGGCIASHMAVNYFLKGSSEINITNIPAFFIKKAEEVNKIIYELVDENGNRIKAGTTLVSVVILENKLYWLSIGDSRLYIIRNNKIKQITKDHNYFLILNDLLKEGKINLEEYKRKSKDGNALISYLGIKALDLIDINIDPFFLYPEDIIMLASDGLFKILSENTLINQIHKSTKETADNYINLVKKSNLSSVDNTTLILIKAKEK